MGAEVQKSNSNDTAYYPQYLAERHFPSSQDPLQITVQVEIDGKRQSEEYPATLTIKHCFDNYYSYFLDLPRELRTRIRKAGEIKGWSQVDELTIKICLGSKSNSPDDPTSAVRPLTLLPQPARAHLPCPSAPKVWPVVLHAISPQQSSALLLNA